MKPVTWDSEVCWDDPNLRWGDPSYLLEPGDPGYVADPSSASFPAQTTKHKSKAMAKQDYIKTRDVEFSAQLQLFKSNIAIYSAALGLTPAQMTAQAADADAFRYALDCQDLCSNCAQQWTAWRDLTRYGGSGSTTDPGVAVFPTHVTPVASGVEKRFRDLVKQIKSSPAYNVSIGEVLGIEGSQKPGPDFTTFGPELSLEVTGTAVFVRWGWRGFADYLQFIEIQVDRGTGFLPLVFDSTPNYLDTTPLPAEPQTWTYRAIYRHGEQRVGQWSPPVSINVKA